MVHALSGLLCWSLCQYWGHRVSDTFSSLRGDNSGVHHLLGITPRRRGKFWRRSIFATGLVPLGMVMVTVAWVIVFGRLEGLMFGGALLAAAGIDDMLHFLLHRKVENSILIRLRSLHLTHHRKPACNFGIFFGLPWDWVFGTLRE